jgi:hypothetical protein
MYEMMIDVCDEENVFLFRGPGCRTRMPEWWRDHLRRIDQQHPCLGTIGGKTEIVRQWERE